jgi:hypothetical protein
MGRSHSARMTTAALAGLLSVLAGNRSARGQDPDDRGADRRDLYVRLGAGAGYSSGNYIYSGMSNPGFGPVVPLSFKTALHDAHGEVEVAVGNALGRGVAFAGVGGARLVLPIQKRDRLAGTTIEGALLGKLGLLVDLFLMPLDETHFIAGGGWSAAGFMASGIDEAAADNIVEAEPVSGPYVEAGAGYRLTARFDLLARVSYTWLEGDHTTYRPLGVTVLASWLHF